MLSAMFLTMATLPKFKNEKLLIIALTHRSYLNEEKSVSSSNERLEFLGDAVISFLTSNYLFQNFPKLHEGDLTNLRSLLVRTESLSDVAKKIGLGEVLKLSKGEEESGGRTNTTLLANTFEAVVGALFLDQGVSAVEKLLSTHLFPMAKTHVLQKTLKDGKSLFQEFVQDKKLPSPVYKTLGTEGPEHAKTFTVGVFVKETLWGKGKGRSKQEAEQKAAKVAIANFRKS